MLVVVRCGMPRGPAAVAIELTDEERTALERMARRRRSAAGLAQRCRIVLACAEGLTNVAAAECVGVSVPTVRRWRGRYARLRLDGLLDEPRPGQPRRISDEQVEDVIVKTLESAPPDGGTYWSTRQMAAASGLNQTAVSRIWRAFGLQPHRVEHWKLSEKSQIQGGGSLGPDPARAAGHAGADEPRLHAPRHQQPVLPP
jgi:transposase